MIEDLPSFFTDTFIKRTVRKIGKGMFIFFNLFQKKKLDINKIHVKKFDAAGWVFIIVLICLIGYLIYKLDTI